MVKSKVAILIYIPAYTHTHTYTLSPWKTPPCNLCWALNTALSSYLSLIASSFSNTDCGFKAALWRRSRIKLCASEQLYHRGHRAPSHFWPSLSDEGAYWPVDVHVQLSGSAAGQVTGELLRPESLDDAYRHLSRLGVCDDTLEVGGGGVHVIALTGFSLRVTFLVLLSLCIQINRKPVSLLCFWQGTVFCEPQGQRGRVLSVDLCGGDTPLVNDTKVNAPPWDPARHTRSLKCWCPPSVSLPTQS